jgi:phthiocerol/phenolphthiocerol synthesis type-I polyketide synthase E
VSPLNEKLTALSPKKRKLLERMLSGSRQTARKAVFEPDALQSFSLSEERTRTGTRKFYNTINRQLAGTVFGEYSYFLNYGYLADSSTPRSSVELPPQFLNRTSAQLVLELIDGCDLAGKRFLDIGCGRGGAIMMVKKYFHAALRVGLDLSSEAIAFCNRIHRDSATHFMEGDAERLPFSSSSFDVVGNVESSHGYLSIESFYREVWRVLAPGGAFLYTDLFTRSEFVQHERLLREVGFVLEQERDVTRNVLLSCREVGGRRTQAFDQVAERNVIGEFLSTPESSSFAAMDSGAALYKMFRLRKRW